jgi:hypothetical protein
LAVEVERDDGEASNADFDHRPPLRLISEDWSRAYITGKRIPKIFVVPDIYAVDCALDVFVKEVYERFYRLREGDVVIDVGAHVGMFTIKAAMSVGEKGKVVAVEPVEENLRLLRKNVELHELNNVVIIGKACSREGGRAIFAHRPGQTLYRSWLALP